MTAKKKLAVLGAVALLAGCAGTSSSPTGKVASVPAGVPAIESNVARQGYFFVGGRYVGEPDRPVMIGQMYVEVWVPREVKHPYPMVFFHGASSTGTTWMQTPDGRRGWAHFFVDQGYIVYITDQPARGRSAYDVQHQGRQIRANAANSERVNTAPAEYGLWPQAKLHTQYPGTGKRGDPVFDAGQARAVSYLASNAETQQLVQNAGTALLDRIGPAILITHSQAGPFGWLLADARPKLVRGIVAVEPSGPPFEGAVLTKGPARAWGPTEIRITYDPPVNDPKDIAREKQTKADGPDLVLCTLQAGTPRMLPNLRGIPIVIITGEASYHAPYDHCTSQFLRQAGVEHDFVRLADVGIRGNGHMMMLEKNNLEISAFLRQWLEKRVK